MPVSVSRRGPVAVLTIDNPPVNAITPALARELEARVAEAVADGEVAAIVLTGAGRNFIAGYDIREFVRITSGETEAVVDLGSILNRIEDSPKPLIAAIRGAALGGGLEVAIACHYRVASPDALLGQPEVKLGLIPGAGATQRLPRLTGSSRAAALCTFGEPVRGPEALAIGLLDEVAEDPVDAAVAMAAKVGPRRTRDLPISEDTYVPPGLSRKALALPAPPRAIQAVEGALKLSFEDGLREEARLFRECLFSNESKSLIHVFLGEREAARVPGVPAVPAPDIKLAAVIGGGTMGIGIAMTYANAGIEVLLKETSLLLADKAMNAIHKNYQGSVLRGRMKQAQADERMARIKPVLDYNGFERAGIIIEAAFEDMELKRRIFAEIDAVANADAILATNTSSLNIDTIAAATGRPGRVIGHHFFSPAHVMKLIEIVRGAATDPAVIGASLALAKRLGKIGVVVGNCKGFVGNRMFHCYRREAQFLVEEGARIEDVDGALTDFGMAMGPLTVGDLAGLDVGWRIRQQHRHLEAPGVRKPLIEDRLCEAGRFGQKTRAGWYRYDEERNRIPDPEVNTLVQAVAREAGIDRRFIGREEILRRCMDALVEEGRRILDEGIALRSSDIDVIYVHGYGFPAHKGGPMKWAELDW
ncbi:MAG: 3-hydroxyacyl-CoA dehydrogenase [Acidobacteria bacterium]|nr:3-hydroxyacyl-CoA dehydrogenase [Acidobacteriota bacterium]